jgi:hypothetical protein
VIRRKKLSFIVTSQGSGFEAKKQATFRQSSLLFEGDVVHRRKKEAQYGGKWAFWDQNVSTLTSYHLLGHTPQFNFGFSFSNNLA